ncbi:helix-turn-helix domain-containing protein [Aquisphaera insulae]|uniref:helix-turn-helix domain-containing protein n=1 Tax=Aquisphaera insulae TaxID=2712864 RepID=UPI0013EDA820|nr:helix-turn-helix domain-containing protein [Aquisphaera insulae]
MASYFFRVEHDLLRSEAFKSIGGSAIKVYLVIGLYSDFGTDWAYPSIRTIARQAGLSRQTVITAIEDLTRAGVLAASRSKGRSTAYKILRQPAPAERPTGKRGEKPDNPSRKKGKTGPEFLDLGAETGPIFLDEPSLAGPEPGPVEARTVGRGGRDVRPEQEPASKTDETTTIPIPGTPFRMTAEGRLLVAVDLQELLTDQGIPKNLAGKLVAQKDPEAVAKVLLNALYLQSQGKLQNGAGYIRAGIEDGYDLLPQVATRLEGRRRELESQLRALETRHQKSMQAEAKASEEAAIAYVLEQLGPEEVERLTARAISLLPEPLVRRNPTLSNPFVRGKVYELACGEPVE